MIQISETLYRNNNLFSNYYLEKYIPESPEWKENDHVAAFEQIKKIYARESASIKTLNEKQLENHFFNEIFSILGFVYEVTEPTYARNFPDYAFFFDRNGLDDAHKNKETIPFFTNAVAIGEVKQWKVDLDKVSKNEYNISENPSLQIWTYLEDTEQKWGILTNGRIWRLYCKERRRDNYLEIDLLRLIESNDIDTFRFFYYFFRKDAFVKSKEGQAFLDRVLNESKEYAEKIGDDLKDNVYLAMKKIAEGFINQKSNHLDGSDQATLARVQNNSMILLYRFLFLLYAEGKGLLDLHDQRYREYYSFHHIKHFIAETQNGPAHQRFDTVKCSLQGDLKVLFKLVDEGSESFGIPKTEYFIPAYNGGLFDPQKHPDLEHWEISDKYLADAIDLLSRSKIKEGHRDFVDYSTLEIRNLGSIYEGLLEYKLKIAETDLIVNNEEWIALDAYNAIRKKKKSFADFAEIDQVKAGHLYLSTDKGERKSSGSYYTPDYIVNYIVKNTIGPVVQQKWKDAQEKNESCIDATLSINVLDPAMGSGHFLVGAVDFLSQKLLEAVQKDFEAGKIADTTPYTNDWARRDVVSHCIYGVDLNELAVELAKVGLWLTTISKDKPLSFLDHRLKQGNSLIGSRLTNLRFYPGKEPKEITQTELPTSISPRFIGHILAKIAELDAIEDNDIEDIKNKEKTFEEFKQLPEYQRANGLANVYTATYFGNEITKTEKKSSEALYQDLVWAIAGDEREWQSKTWHPWFKQAKFVAKDKSFFHWELEFPEIFFDAGKLQENPGWDAVIGNPPYINAIELNKVLSEYEKPYWKTVFISAMGAYDIYIVFFEQALKLVKKGHDVSFITPNKFLSAPYAEKFREYLVKNHQIVSLCDFSRTKVFEDPSIYPVVTDFKRLKQTEKYFLKVTIVKNWFENDCKEIIHSSENLSALPEYLLGFLLSPDVDLLLKITQNTDPLSKISTVQATSTAGESDAFVAAIHDIKKSKDDFKFVNTGLIDRYCTTWGIIGLDHKGQQFQAPYLDLSNSVVSSMRRNIYESRKIIFAKIAKNLEGFIDNNGEFASANTNCVFDTKYNLFFYGAILNSTLISFIYRIYFGALIMSGGYFQFQAPQLKVIPIRRIAFKTPVNHRDERLNEAKAMYLSFAQNIDPLPILAFISDRLSAQPEESDVVHDVLAFLAEQIVEMNNEKNAEITAFLNFIEGETGASVETLSNKTLIQEYYMNDFTKFVDVLENNKSKIKEGYNPKSRAHHDILKDWYDSSVAKLTPLMTKIDETNALIDQIVYILYGLTDEEIAIVEGTKK